MMNSGPPLARALWPAVHATFPALTIHWPTSYRDDVVIDALAEALVDILGRLGFDTTRSRQNERITLRHDLYDLHLVW
jgi:hypothetical protein